jgi:acyl carrier protein
VADTALGLCPAGVPGELLLAGAGLARGYLGRPDATAERFVPDGLTAGVRGGRLYRTGDLARRLPDGEIEYLGRIDRQVKVRGVRLELGEIEAALAACPGVAEAAAFVREVGPGDRRLGACVVAAPGATVDPAELKRILGARLPEALVPSSIALVPSLPVLGSGKLDRAALLSLAASHEAATPYTAPETVGEKAIAATVATVLGRERVGREDNFFDLGAHSLLMVRLASALGEALGREIPVIDLFRFPSVASLAAHLGSSEEEESAVLKERFEQRADLRRRAAAGRRRPGRGEG